ncbi:MAG: urease accessory UreF family protein [Acidobacteriota bacterium]
MPAPFSEWLVWQLADSAFPTGSFAHSFGLEAAHQQGEVPDAPALRAFLRGSLLQAGHGVMPLVNAAYRSPERFPDLDRLANVFLTNPVANRASRVQGRTLVATCARVWRGDAIAAFDRTARAGYAHLGPVTGVALRHVGAPLWVVQRLVLYLAARGVLSAAVRLGIAGSYEVQRIQAESAPEMDRVLARCAQFDEGDLAQPSPLIDLLQAGHDRLYSRLFQS